MVNVYGDYSETGYNNPYYVPPAPTRAQADYQNYVGRTNRANVGMGSNYGEAERYYQQQQQQAQQPVSNQPRVGQPAQTRVSRGAAYDMAVEAERRGDKLDYYTAQRAIEQGYVPKTGLYTSSKEESRQTVPTRDYEPLPSNLSANDRGFGETITGFTPYGRGQTELPNVKVKYTKYGEVGFYQKDPTRDTWRLVSSGSSAALQSGQFSVNEPVSPVVFTQASGGSVLSPRANVSEAKKVMANPSAFSRPGAEVYGGYVQPLDNRTVQSTGARLSTYQNKDNLANLVDPFAVNVPKSQREPVSIPWGNAISASTPAISEVTVAGKSVAPKPTVSPAVVPTSLRAPFKSEVTHTIIPPTGETTIGVPFTDITVFKGTIPGISLVETAVLQKPTIRTSVASRPAEENTLIGEFFPNAKSVKIASTMEGLDTAPSMAPKGEMYSGGSPEVDALGVSLKSRNTDIETRKSYLDTIAARNVNQKNEWVGTEEDLQVYNAESISLEKDVGSYNADVERYNTLAKEKPTFVTPYDLTKQKVSRTTTFERQGQSGFDMFVAPVAVPYTKLNKQIGDSLPSAEVGEKATRLASLSNPFILPHIVATEVTRKINPSGLETSETIEGMVGMGGQYTQFKEAPLLTVGSYAAVGLPLGVATRGVTGAAGFITSKIPASKGVITTGGKWVGYGLIGLYGADITYRSTDEFTNFKPSSVVSKSKAIVMQEAVPMGIGIGHGYGLPEAVIGKKVDVGYYPMDTTRVGSGGMFEQGRMGIDPAELASGGQFRSTPYSGPAFVKTGTIREGGIFGQGGAYPRVRGAIRNALPEPGYGTKIPSFNNEAGVFSFGGVRAKKGVGDIPDVLSKAQKYNLEPGMPETAYIFDAKTGKGIGMVVGEQGRVPASKIKAALKTLPSGSEVALYHTHPSTTPLIEIKSNWDMMRSGKITPKEFVRSIPNAVSYGAYEETLQLNPSLVDMVSAKSREGRTLTSGDWNIKIVEEGVVHRGGVSTYVKGGRVSNEHFLRFLNEGRTPLELSGTGLASETAGVRSRPGVGLNPVTGIFEMPSAESITGYGGGKTGRVRTRYDYEFMPSPVESFGDMFPTRPVTSTVKPAQPVAIDTRFGIIPKMEPTSVAAKRPVTTTNPFAYITPMEEMRGISRASSRTESKSRAVGMTVPMIKTGVIAKSAARSEIGTAAKSRIMSDTMPFLKTRARAEGFAKTDVPSIVKVRSRSIATPTPSAKSSVQVTPDIFATTLAGSAARSRSAAMPEVTPRPYIPVKSSALIPPFISLPSGSGGGGGFVNPQYFRGFVERSPTWTVEEMSSSLFTGKLGGLPKRKPEPSRKQGRTKKDRNIRR